MNKLKIKTTRYNRAVARTVYVATKNGRAAKPTVTSLQKVISDFNKDQKTNFTIKDVTYYKKD